MDNRPLAQLLADLPHKVGCASIRGEWDKRAGVTYEHPCSCSHAEITRRVEEMEKAERRKEWDGAEFCWRCDEVLVVDDQHFCHKCGARFLCDHSKGMTEYCAPCGRVHSE